MSGNELPKVIEKNQADIDAAIATIQSSDIPHGTKDVAVARQSSKCCLTSMRV
jgi:hypothetical protein